ncbi:YbaB/EbfC family DNA-binding protein [Nocardia sp. SYP-A9097]|uniref:YbaB/EbfC family nucleoid-associated protein n=1 Tax=Nocardia sp. SYP-A9097 TaxID=2663237 RepID=UPI00129A6A56|nr:YbaB/EbfC family nucleoid-associated protein [Nocardia sp. SYP-A9097]MRH93189.1 YbaB/EbfC family DNA-binding protein [Nocardia sp. SYP-A9097]
MANEVAKEQLAELVELVQGGMSAMARAQQERARLTATAHAAGRRVTITVNADCIVIKTEFSSDIDDLTYSEIAAAVTAATQDAAAQVQQKAQEIVDAVHQEQARIPALSEFFPAMPDIRTMIPTPPVVSTAPPGSPDRAEPEPEPAVVFTDVEEWEHDQSSVGRSSIAAPEW